MKYMEEVEIIISYESIYFYFYDLIASPLSILFLLCKIGRSDFDNP
tara:strand:+ start:1384 stop:1521 length:138 start_codon:yes stop_codon:yes gene_type:complete